MAVWGWGVTEKSTEDDVSVYEGVEEQVLGIGEGDPLNGPNLQLIQRRNRIV